MRPVTSSFTWLWPFGSAEPKADPFAEALSAASRTPELRECARMVGELVEAFDRDQDVWARQKRWNALLDVAKANGIAIEDILAPNIAAPCVLEVLLQQKRWDAAESLKAYMPVGLYAQGRIQITKKGIFTVRDNKHTGPACFWSDGYSHYCGGLRENKLHGEGMLDGFYKCKYENGRHVS